MKRLEMLAMFPACVPHYVMKAAAVAVAAIVVVVSVVEVVVVALVVATVARAGMVLHWCCCWRWW